MSPSPSPDRPTGRPRSLLTRVPLRWRRLALLGALTGSSLVGYATVLVLFALVRADPVSWTDGLPTLLGSFVGSAAVVWGKRRPISGTVTRGGLEDAVRRGRLPADADAGLWLRVLRGELDDLRARRTAGVATAVLLLACGLGLALAADPAWAGLLVAAGALACAGGVAWAGRHRERRIRRLLDRPPAAP
ncbi:hypothetical protein [Geodermatophilus sp. DSM 44513]|uniref:hypothetical protein n=1 Tax=Geodermatophilus sp. DSM 44513 TaxID=1528104 RepID=UPI00127E4ED5|nr:hypothetical protein [Geodermatophilus sp. DSM 44513]WNV73930.1 hypothetical protein RTG05_13135 [Geodermatophilus sp. DSM 44513]